MLVVAVARSCFYDNAIRYVLLVVWLTSRFHVVERVARIKDCTNVSSSSPNGSIVREICGLQLPCFQQDFFIHFVAGIMTNGA